MYEQLSDSELLEKWKKEQDQNAAEELWRRYWRRIAGLAGTILYRDTDSLPGSVFRSFFEGAGTGRLSLTDQSNLWPLLAIITMRKAHKRRNKATRQLQPEDIELLQEALSHPPSHESMVDMKDELERLLDLLQDDECRKMAWLWLQGHTNEDVAALCDCGLAKVERKRRLFRETLKREMQS